VDLVWPLFTGGRCSEVVVNTGLTVFKKLKKKLINFFLQKSYEKIPNAGESYLNLINTLECSIVASITQTGFNQTFELNASSNHVLYNLQAGQEYYLNVQAKNRSCSAINNNEVGLSFNATSKHVSLKKILFHRKVFPTVSALKSG
jgi:hypothetical protein